MTFDLDARTATLSVGELADFTLGPREAMGGPQGIWRAQLGTHWHGELRRQLAAIAPEAQFEVVIGGALPHAGWRLELAGRIDQLLPTAAGDVLREVKTVLRPLPVDETELRADYAGYFVQLATYRALRALAGQPVTRAELVFVEPGSGLTQVVVVTRHDEQLLTAQLWRVTEFLDARRAARDRLARLEYRPAFTALRPGQEPTRAALTTALATAPIVLFEAPTGFGKTAFLLETALEALRAGHCERVLYLTSKSTGQLQVVHTLHTMTTPLAPGPATEPAATTTPEAAVPSPTGPRPTAETSGPAVSVWHVRPKREHCINHEYHCTRDTCRFLAALPERWPTSGLARFYLFPGQARDLETLRAAGQETAICPYEITRAALPFCEVWLGDFNYLFSPGARGLFTEAPGFRSEASWLIVDEAHNLPARAADALSVGATAQAAADTRHALEQIRAPAKLLLGWDGYARALSALRPCDRLDDDTEADLRDACRRVARLLGETALDYAALPLPAAEELWRTAELTTWWDRPDLTRLAWVPRAGELRCTCLDAAPWIAENLRGFGRVLLASATFGPAAEFAAACGLDQPREPAAPPATADLDTALEGTRLTRRVRRALRDVTTGSELLRVEEDAASTDWIRCPAEAPWREGAYDVAIDLRVDTTYRQRERHLPTTAGALAALRADSAVAIAAFFPSYSYAEAAIAALADRAPVLHAALQPRGADLAAQAAWVEESLFFADVLCLVLGSSFAESIDVLGGRLTHALVAGPALPEVNAVQRARAASLASLGPAAAFRRTYQIPGMQKVNQALGRLVRAPGQRARVLLHCRRFAEADYARLLAPEYQFGHHVTDASSFTAWLSGGR